MLKDADEVLESRWMPAGYVYIIDAKRLCDARDWGETIIARSGQ